MSQSLFPPLDTTTSYVAAPRVRMLVNGATLPVLRATINSNNFLSADSYTATLLLSDPVVAQSAANQGWWLADGTGANGTPVLVTIQIDPGTAPVANWTTMVVGEVDHLDFDPFTYEMNLSGRDRTAEFIEAPATTGYKNQRSCDIVAKIAANHPGLKTQITSTTSMVGHCSNPDHDLLASANFNKRKNEWDLLCTLADREGFDVFIQGDTLYFQPEAQSTASPFALQVDTKRHPWVVCGNATDVKFDRALTLAKEVIVIVNSWSTKTAKAVSATAKATGVHPTQVGNAKGAATSNTTTYTFNKPNMTIQAAQAYAQARLKEISQHERKVTIQMPGDVVLSPRQIVRVTGTGTGLDMDYYIHEITREISVSGFTQTVAAKNSPPKTDSVTSSST